MNFNSETIQSLEGVVKKLPGSPAFARLADHYRSMGHVDNAIALCENGVKNNPDYPTGHLLLGRCYYEKERVEDAVAEFTTVLKLDRKNIFALKIMGDIYAQKGQKTTAAQYYKRAADCDPLNPQVRDMFRRYEKYFRDPTEPRTPAASASSSPAAAMTESIGADLPQTEMVDRETRLPAADIPENLSDSQILSVAAPDLPDADIPAPSPAAAEAEPAADADISQAVSFDDLMSEPAPAPAPEPAPEEAAVEPVFPETSPELEQALPPIATEMVEKDTGIESLMLPDAPEEISAPEPETAPAPLAPAPEPESRSRSAAVETEMLDLPPEMTGLREERVGDFKTRKSVLNRLMEEQNALLETYDEEMAAPALPPAAAPAPQEVSTSTPGMDGYYNVSGDNAEESAAVALDDIDNVEIGSTINEESLVTEAPAVDELPAETSDENLGFQDLLTDMDADDELKRFVETMDNGKEKPAPAQGKALAKKEAPIEPPMPITEEIDFPAAPVEEVETISPAEPALPQPEAADSGISSSAAGMDGFYNVSGDNAETDSALELGDIDTVEIGDAIDEATLETADAGIPETTELELTLDADQELVIPPLPGDAPAAAAPAPEPEPEPEPAAIAPEPEPQPPAPAPAPAPAKKEPRKKTDKAKAKSAAKVVSNVATTSLAEIYLRQGHKEQALTVYRKILAQDPDNADIQGIVATLEREIENDES